MHLKNLCVALAILILSGCESKALHYRLCTLIDNKVDDLYFYCESTDPKKKAYSIWVKEAAKESYLGMPIEDYGEIVKYAKQVKKDLERCRR